MSGSKKRVKFSNVGRRKLSWVDVVETDNDDNFIDQIYTSIEKKSPFMSSDFDVIYEPEENIGKILVGGFREVGTFSVILNEKYDLINNG